MKTRLLPLAALALAMGCEGTRGPTAPAAPVDPSKIISDGAHGGNKDFFFMPPMVPLPLGNPDFELGKFNNTLAPSLKIEICELNADHLKTGGLPTEQTTCGTVKKTFAPGTVNVVNLPVRQNGWWTLFNLPPDGFYYVLWDTRQSNLDVTKYYRIKVFISGNSTPLGVADVDPMKNLLQWKYSLTGDVIQMVDDVMLPIPFRVEKGGGSTLCGGASVCGSATITNNSPTGFQTVTVDGGAGAVAGVQFPNGWLPANGPQSVVVTVAQVDLGSTDPRTGAETTPCHAGLPLQQFPGCFRFTTTPTLQPIDESGRQFAKPVIAAVCYTLYGTGDPREKFAEMYASGPNEPPHALDDASDAGILSAATRNCSTSTQVIGAIGGNALTRFASSGWRTMKSGLDQVFGVKTAYAIDLGLGGYMTEFSNVGPALSATIEPITATDTSLVAGTLYTPFVRLVGSNHHDGQHRNSTGLGGLSVTWTVGTNGGTLSPQGETGGTASQLVAITNSLPITEGATSGGGYSTVNWALPNVAGTYTITASGPALGGPVTFTVVVTAPLDFSFLQGTWLNDNTSTGDNVQVSFSVDGAAVSVHALGACSPTSCDWGTTPADMSKWNSEHTITAVWNQGFAIVTQTIRFVSSTQVSIVNFYDFQAPDTRIDFSSTAQTFTKQADVVPFTTLIGSWQNPNPSGSDVAFLGFSLNTAGGLNITETGRCDESDPAGALCGWDPTAADLSRWDSFHEITFVVERDFGTKSMTLQLISSSIIRVTTYTHFTDGSGRSDYTSREDLGRTT